MSTSINISKNLNNEYVLGTHIIAEFHGSSNISCPETVKEILLKSAIRAEATVLSAHVHDFGEGMGVTGVVVLSESHISIHTWPEYNYAAIDIFMCGSASPEVALEYLKEKFSPESVSVKIFDRGVNC